MWHTCAPKKLEDDDAHAGLCKDELSKLPEGQAVAIMAGPLD
jgi:hypothetical protein